MKRDAAIEAQIRAAHPGESTWLSANAGSGKTRVLTDRVARLLLEDAPPQNILCLTYTKAAASEMQNRLFGTLGEWAMKPDKALRKALTELGVEQSPDLTRARRLFARAIETPGGLKIQTIHSFCAGLLRRFPLEAGVTPNFTEMDERAAKILQGEVLETLAEGPQAAAFDALAAIWSGDDIAHLLREIATHRAGFVRPVSREEIWGWFGLEAGLSTTDLPALCFTGHERGLIAKAGPILARQSATMVRLAETLAGLDFENPGQADMEALFGAFLYRKDGLALPEAKTKSVPTKKAAEALGPLLDPLHEFMRRVASVCDRRNSLYCAQQTLVLHNFARPFLAGYERRKARAGWLDFDDLIERTASLLGDPAVAAWVLYKLDGGLDHVLVDEAQDTSPAQWQVIERLTGDFATGESARTDVTRTIFVVGDPKQSIYSFQGAEPAAFTRMQAGFGVRLEGAGERLWPRRLDYSFRSSPAVLTLVDRALRDLPGLESAPLHHIAFHADKPGRVDLWPAVEKGEKPEPPAWFDPAEIVADADENVVLAERIAHGIGEMLARESVLDEKKKVWRRVTPRDILILVRRRTGGLFDALIRALKQAGLPVAGADQLRIGAELAVKDLAALLKFLATPEDDLSLAAALRSPLLGWSEAELYALAQPRAKDAFLWSALRESGETTTLAMLDDLRNHADFLRPYDLIDRILTRHGGRARLLARLGAEAEDGIDALLSQALTYESLEIPSLTGFLIWLEADEVTVKRRQGATADQIRVMTVHGAKGLEAPVVILPDTAMRKARESGALLKLGEAGHPVWKPNKPVRPQVLDQAAEARSQADEEERNRLLYVAMTRAGQWLIVAASGETGEGRDSWYALLSEAMAQSGAVVHSHPGGEGLRLRVGAWGSGGPDDGDRELDRIPLPEWARMPPAPPAPQPKNLSPSGLGGDKALAGEGAGLEAESAMRRGTGIHLLLEHLPGHPPEDWPAMAAGLLAEDAPELLKEAEQILKAPDMAELFGPQSRAEVELSAPLSNVGGRLHGVVDRLVLRDGEVLAVDFKSNAVVPDRPEDVPEGILRQMGAYRRALAQIFPDQRIGTAIVWTRTVQRMDLPDSLVDTAFARLDATGHQT